MPFTDPKYIQGFVEGNFAYMETQLGFMPAKANICAKYPSTVIHIAQKISSGNAFAFAYSLRRNDSQFNQLIENIDEM